MNKPIVMDPLPSWSRPALLGPQLKFAVTAGRVSCAEFGSHFAAIEWMAWYVQQQLHGTTSNLDIIQRMKTEIEAAASTDDPTQLLDRIAELQVLLWELNRRAGNGPVELLIAAHGKVSESLKGIQG
ncbi:hypothetical protein [Tuwongella immobilis]|uniref:Uncharacterized protein n=1 Tax=Tuwongella immobilis TaxID=692036 RepID=A0A6C2YQL9_9BACT|nr:hypothetical protein [Tuwongella immobilis]VIP03938.1 unnamed protein product [Tuwongella immobilis]VTS05243.1 unnamed protein product [Tuwongella immobilis]